ncbi:hypothetical protein Emed_007103 [Eimeria media]
MSSSNTSSTSSSSSSNSNSNSSSNSSSNDSSYSSTISSTLSSSTGVLKSHEDMFDSWWRNALIEAPAFSEWPDNCYDGIDNDANGYVDDCFGYSFANRSGEISAFAGSHGTAVASSCCATTNNGKGIASLGWNLRPMALKIDG